MIHLRSLVEKTSDADVLRDMISFAAERLIEIEVGALTGAGHGEKSAARLVHATAIAIATGRREAHPGAAQEQLLARRPRAAPGRGKGAHRGDSEGLGAVTK